MKLGKTKDSRTRGKAQPLIAANTDNAFINYLLSKGYSTSTAQGYWENVTRFTKWLKKENTLLEQVRYADVLHYVQGMRNKVNQSTISSSVNSLRHYYNHQINKGECTDNPTDQIQIKGVKKNRLYDILEPLELDQLYHQFITTTPEPTPKDNTHTQKLREPKFQMQKTMLGLLIYQGVTAQELSALKTEDVKLREGMIYIPAGRRSNERTLKLEAVQILEIQEYLIKTRPEILQITNKETDQLFTSVQGSPKLHHTISSLANILRQQNPGIQDLQQVRASVIVKWLKNHNLRKAQYMAGHRFVSSTEKYMLNDLKGLQEDINKFHPIA